MLLPEPLTSIQFQDSGRTILAYLQRLGLLLQASRGYQCLDPLGIHFPENPIYDFPIHHSDN